MSEDWFTALVRRQYEKECREKVIRDEKGRFARASSWTLKQEWIRQREKESAMPRCPAGRSPFDPPHPCPRCEGGVLVQRYNSMTGSGFLGCGRFPNCDYTEPQDDNLTPEQRTKYDGLSPEERARYSRALMHAMVRQRQREARQALDGVLSREFEGRAVLSSRERKAERKRLREQKAAEDAAAAENPIGARFGGLDID